MKRVVIDTNVIVRLLIQDIPDQFEQARDILQRIEDGKLKGVVSILVWNELIWILEHFYELKREYFIPQLIKIVSLNNIIVPEVSKDILDEIFVKMQESSIDFTDYYLFYSFRDDEIFSFDKHLQKLIKIE